MNIIEKAIQIAAKAHKEQIRKSDGSPYIAHPLMVARILDTHDFEETVIAAAIVHDVLEDTDVSESELRAQLGDAVVDIVTAVSEDTSLVWEERKEQYAKQVSQGGESVMAVSVADKIHNTQSLIDAHATMGPTVWEVFNRGKEKKIWFEKLLLSKIKEKWNHPLVDEYQALIENLESLED